MFKNHPFTDSNKRSGIFVSVQFLKRADWLDVARLNFVALTLAGLVTMLLWKCCLINRHFGRKIEVLIHARTLVSKSKIIWHLKK
ncbi:MAG: hypothetical protein C0412_11535 [Flavobacterium sp.]|nr:hypothetical protein [Flavobacterium sp.]